METILFKLIKIQLIVKIKKKTTTYNVVNCHVISDYSSNFITYQFSIIYKESNYFLINLL